MMDWTDRHCRYFLRGFSPDVLLYTEMITAAAIPGSALARRLDQRSFRCRGGKLAAANRLAALKLTR